MTDTRGTFRLKNVKRDILDNNYVNIETVYINRDPRVGYAKFYETSPSLNGQSFKLNFTDLTTSSVNHSFGDKQTESTGTSSTTDAYFLGGLEQSPSQFVSNCRKIDYGTNTSEDVPSGLLPTPREGGGGLASQNHSYYLGGNGPGVSTDIFKLIYSNDTTSLLPSTTMASARQEIQTGTNGGTGGYAFAGRTNASPAGSNYSTTQKITFANDTRTSLPSSDMVLLSENPGTNIPYFGVGKIQNTTHCYYGTGSPGGNNSTSTFQKMNFSSETWAVSPSKLPVAIRRCAGMTASTTQGAVAGGSNIPANPSGTSNVYLLTFASESWAAEPALQLGGPSANNDKGETASTSLMDSMHFVPRSGIPLKTYKWKNDTLSTPSKGYFIGGFTSGTMSSTPSPAILNQCDKIDMVTDTGLASPGGTLPQKIKRATATSTLTDSYYSGHNRPEIFKLTFATDTHSQSSMSRSPGTWYDQAAAGNQNIGYFAGGSGPAEFRYPGPSPSFYPSSTMSYIIKMTYASETRTTDAVTLPEPRGGQAGTGNQNHAYFSGGWHYPGSNPGPWFNSNGRTSKTDKISYSTDSIETLTDHLLMSRNIRMSSTSNSTDAYFKGGMGPTSGGYNSNAQKLTFATDTFSYFPSFQNTPRYGGWWPASGQIQNQGAIANENNMFFGGGFNGPSPSSNEVRSWIDKFDFATETNYPRTTLTLRNNKMLGGNSGACPKGFGLMPADMDVPVETTTPNTTAIPSGSQVPNIGYAALGIGGANGPIRAWKFTDKVNMTSDTSAVVPALANMHSTWCGANFEFNLKDAAHLIGGSTTGTKTSDGVSMHNKVTYASDTYSAAPNFGVLLPGILSGPAATNAKWWGCGSANNEQKGYIWNNLSPADMPDIIRYNFSTQTAQVVLLPWNNSPGSLNSPITDYQGATTFCNDTHGYIISGYGGGSSGFPNGTGPGGRTKRFSYATEIIQYNPTGNTTRRYTSGIMVNNIGYIAGGGQNGVAKLSIPTDSVSTIPSSVPNSPSYNYGHGVTGNLTQGYWMGGCRNTTDFWTVANGPDCNSYINKFVYATDTWSTLSNKMGSERARFAGFGPLKNQLNTNLPVPNVI